MPPTDTIVQMRLTDLRKLLREAVEQTTSTRRWESVSDFKKREDKTTEQMKYMREKNPLLFKWTGTRWLIDTKEYNKLFK